MNYEPVLEIHKQVTTGGIYIGKEILKSVKAPCSSILPYSACGRLARLSNGLLRQIREQPPALARQLTIPECSVSLHMVQLFDYTVRMQCSWILGRRRCVKLMFH